MSDLEPAAIAREPKQHRCKKPWWGNFAGRRWQCDDCGAIFRYSDGYQIGYAGPGSMLTCYGGKLGWLYEDDYDWSTERSLYR